MITLFQMTVGTFAAATYRVYEGKSFQVEFYYDSRGNMPAFDYYSALSEDHRARFFAVATHVANAPFGTIHPKAIYNMEDPQHRIFALKPSQHRFFNFQTSDHRIVLTNAYKKESQKMDNVGKNALKAAVRMKKDYEARRKDGTYYEKD
jgi:hypothetical protein